MVAQPYSSPLRQTDHRSPKPLFFLSLSSNQSAEEEALEVDPGLHYLLMFSFDSLLYWLIYFPFRIRWPHALYHDHTTTRDGAKFNCIVLAKVQVVWSLL
ncbi:uncharacterized protein LOC114264259 isoform X2 [Camellia sinensis]|uniref:uncharacterized protein LOC114264259 isoform X2 n=1 Tax=Camellia sinensis TaxID=4442 RepID=UPI00103699F2|nr:uncharacterized protein LOC114264259 isoform X2 [Camellia sinensis]